MSARGKYHIIEAETLAARQRHRALIEKALQSSNLTPQMRDDLLWELKQAVIKEQAALKAVKDEEEEENKKKTGDGSDGGEQGSTGGTGSGGGFGARTDTDMAEIDGQEEGLNTLEIFELLLFMAEHDTSPAFTDDTPALNADMLNADMALGAATLLFDRDERIAHVGEPYAAPSGDAPHSPIAQLAALEHHAHSQLGAHHIQLKIHPSAEALFTRQLNYVRVQAPGRKNSSLITVRKNLTLQNRLVVTD